MSSPHCHLDFLCSHLDEVIGALTLLIFVVSVVEVLYAAIYSMNGRELTQLFAYGLVLLVNFAADRSAQWRRLWVYLAWMVTYIVFILSGAHLVYIHFYAPLDKIHHPNSTVEHSSIWDELFADDIAFFDYLAVI